MLTVNPSLNPALAAYAQALGRARNGVPDPDPADNPAPTFTAVLRESLTNAVAKGRAGEQQTAEALVGEADLQSVVEAVNAAEMSLRTVTAIRDRMISAYQDVMRMPI